MRRKFFFKNYCRSKAHFVDNWRTASSLSRRGYWRRPILEACRFSWSMNTFSVGIASQVVKQKKIYTLQEYPEVSALTLFSRIPLKGRSLWYYIIVQTAEYKYEHTEYGPKHSPAGKSTIVKTPLPASAIPEGSKRKNGGNVSLQV